jgi:2-methylisocitrate lyase-like PEP mutase family enzyme
MPTQAAKAERFLSLHRPGEPLLLPNPWDRGSARILDALGYQALATTSGGFALTLGRLDGSVTREEALEHARSIVSVTDLPVSADLEQGFADEPAGVARTVELAIETGLAGCSIEDYTGSDTGSIYEIGLAAERITAAAQAAHGGDVPFVLTARAENYLRGRPDLADTIARLQAYQEAGADVLYAPALTKLADIRELVASVDSPVNVLALPDGPSVADLAAAGVARISIGSGLSTAAYSTLVEVATELRDHGSYAFTRQPGLPALRAVLSSWRTS